MPNLSHNYCHSIRKHIFLLPSFMLPFWDWFILIFSPFYPCHLFSRIGGNYIHTYSISPEVSPLINTNWYYCHWHPNSSKLSTGTRIPSLLTLLNFEVQLEHSDNFIFPKLPSGTQISSVHLVLHPTTSQISLLVSVW